MLRIQRLVQPQRATSTIKFSGRQRLGRRWLHGPGEPSIKDHRGQLLSHVSGSTSTPLSNETLPHFWSRLVDEHGDRRALVVKHEPPDDATGALGRGDCLRWTFAQMDDHVQRLANGLKRTLNVQKGDRVAVLMMNSSTMASLQIATAFAGAILITLNPSYTAKELLRSLRHVEATHLFVVPSLRSSDYLSNLVEIFPSLAGKETQGKGPHVHDEACPSLKHIVLVDNLTDRPSGWESESMLAVQGKGFPLAMDRLNGHAVDYRDVINGDSGKEVGNAREDQIDEHDIINLQLTSGTTGAPKAVSLTSHNLVNNGIALGRLMHLTPSDLLANVPPLFHCFGLTLGNLAAWSCGAGILYPSEGFHALRTLRAAAQENATAIHGVPAHFIAELDLLRRIRAAQERDDQQALAKLGVSAREEFEFQLRTGFTSGSTVPIELMHSIMDLLGAKEQTVVYGMTETSPVSFGVSRHAPVQRRCETVGKVIDHVHAKIVSPEDGHTLPLGQVGELWTAGYIVMKGYWNDEKKTAEALERDEDGLLWMKTGDLAVMDQEGYVEIRGRVKDVIIRGGENLHPPVIENCLAEMDGVNASAAVAVPDAKMGEVVGCFIEASTSSSALQQSLTPASVRQHVKDHLSGQNAPEWVWFLGFDGVPDHMPTTASGKVQKVVLREWAKDLVEKGIGGAR